MSASTTFFDKSHTENNQHLWEKCKNEKLCDVVLIASDDNKMRIPAHRDVLMAASEYFKGMFTSSMHESRSKVVKITDVDGNILRSLVQYCYTGRVEIREDTVVELLRTADMLLISNVVTACSNFLAQLLEPNNCLGYMHFAERHHLCQTLLQKAKDYCLEHFMEVSETDEFFSLTAEQLSELLACDELNVPAEENVFQILMTWIRHDPTDRMKYKDELLKFVRMPLLERSFLVGYISPLCTSAESQRIYMEALEWHTSPGGKIINASRSTKLRRSPQFLFAITLSSAQSYSKLHIHYYCPKRLEWMTWLKDLEHRHDYAVVVVEDNFYFVGGGNARNGALKTAIYLNLKTMTINQISSMTEYRKGCGAAFLNGFLFAMGGWNEGNAVSSVEKWNPKTNTWHEVASMSESRCHFGIAQLDEKLYVVGGMSDGCRLRSVEFYDPAENVWKTVAEMNRSRSCPTVTFINGLLYAVGGRGNITVECYDPEKNIWTMFCSLRDDFRENTMPRILNLNTPICTIFCNKLVACYRDRFQEYNDITNEWEFKTSLNGLANIEYLFPYTDKILISEFVQN